VAHVVWKNYKLSLIPYICLPYEDKELIQEYLENYYKLTEEENVLLFESAKYRIFGRTTKKEDYRVMIVTGKHI